MAKPIVNYTRININLDKLETLHVLDRYKDVKGISRSKAVSQILDACVPILTDITDLRYSANELENRLLHKVYKRDIHRQRNGVPAEKHCLSIWHDKLQSGMLIDFDRYNGGNCGKEARIHTRRDNGIGIIERRHIESLCHKLIGHDDIKYAVFIYFERAVVGHEELKQDSTSSVSKVSPAIEQKSGAVPKPAKTINTAIGNGIALLAKNYFYDEYIFSFEEAILISVIDIMPFGITGITEFVIKQNVFCWVPILAYNNSIVFVPVYKVNPLLIPTHRRPNSVTVVHSAVNSQLLT